MYILIDTWNGENYSEQSGKKACVYKTYYKAMRTALEYADRDALDLECNVEVSLHGEHFAARFTDRNQNSGSYQVLPLKPDSYAVHIEPHTNHVEVLDLDEHVERVKAYRKEIAESNGEL